MSEAVPNGPFKDNRPGLNSPPKDGAAITPTDGLELNPTPRAIWVGNGGTIVVTTLDGDTLTFTNVPSGQYFVFMPKTVQATGTTASGLVGVW